MKIYSEYTAERIAKALERGCWLEEDALDGWRLGLGTRGVGRGWRVPTRSARAAIKRDDVGARDTGMGIIYIAASRIARDEQREGTA